MLTSDLADKYRKALENGGEILVNQSPMKLPDYTDHERIKK